MQRAVRAVSHALDGLYIRAVRLDCQHRAALDGLAVEQHRARAAVGGVAADVGAGQPQVVAEIMDEEEPRLHVSLARLAVDSDVHPNVFRHISSSSPEARWEKSTPAEELGVGSWTGPRVIGCESRR